MVKTRRFDLGEIIRNHIYVREIYAICNKENERCLFSSEDLYTKLTRIYNYLGIKRFFNEEMKVKIKLPSNPNPDFREHWHETNIKQSNENHLIMKIDSFFRYFKNEVVFASNSWMSEFETFPGDKVVISCSYPIPSSKDDLGSKITLMETTNL